MSQTLGQSLAVAIRTAANAYAAGDQVAPCALLWPDPDRLWESIGPELLALIPELFVLGAYAAEKRTGPALWLRCIEARVVEGTPAAGTNSGLLSSRCQSAGRDFGPRSIARRNYHLWLSYCIEVCRGCM